MQIDKHLSVPSSAECHDRHGENWDYQSSFSMLGSHCNHFWYPVCSDRISQWALPTPSPAPRSISSFYCAWCWCVVNYRSTAQLHWNHADILIMFKAFERGSLLPASLGCKKWGQVGVIVSLFWSTSRRRVIRERGYCTSNVGILRNWIQKSTYVGNKMERYNRKWHLSLSSHLSR